MTPRPSALVRWLAPLAVAAGGGPLGCASSKAAPPAPPSAAAPAAPVASAVQDPNAATPDAPVSSGEMPDADAADPEQIPKDCNFRVKGFCFKTDEEACAAAGCDPSHCLVLESHPAQVKCKP